VATETLHVQLTVQKVSAIKYDTKHGEDSKSYGIFTVLSGKQLLKFWRRIVPP
jgi:hypothetical protein